MSDSKWKNVMRVLNGVRVCVSGGTETMESDDSGPSKKVSHTVPATLLKIHLGDGRGKRDKAKVLIGDDPTNSTTAWFNLSSIKLPNQSVDDDDADIIADIFGVGNADKVGG